MEHSAIRIKERGLTISLVVLGLSTLYFALRSANDRHELGKVREQNRILSDKIGNLSVSLGAIRKFTRSTSNLAATAESPKRLLQSRDDLGLVRATTDSLPVYRFGSMMLSAKAGIEQAARRDQESDLEKFTRMVSSIDALEDQSGMILRRLQNLATLLKYNKNILRTIPSMVPVEGRFSSEFGSRLSPFEGRRHMHAGIDIAAAVGAVVRAPADGVITYAGDFENLGKTLVINHGSNILTRYGHLHKMLVRDGATVKKGQAIAQVGNTGRSTGPHLHYEVWVRNVAVNPRDFFFDMTDKGEIVAALSEGEEAPVEPGRKLKKSSHMQLNGMGGEGL